MPADAVIAGAAASLSLLENVIRLAQKAREKDGTPMTVAEFVRRIPGEAFGVAKGIEHQLVKLRKNLIENKVDMGTPLIDLDSSLSWWKHRWDRTPRRAEPLIEGLKEALCVLEDDYVAVASCAEMEETLAASYSEAREAKLRLRKMTDPTRSVGEILDDLIDFAGERAAMLGDMK